MTLDRVRFIGASDRRSENLSVLGLLRSWERGRREKRDLSWPLDVPMLRVNQLLSAQDAGYEGTDSFMWLGAWLTKTMPDVILADWEERPWEAMRWESLARCQTLYDDEIFDARWSWTSGGGSTYMLMEPLELSPFASFGDDEGGVVEDLRFRAGRLSDRRGIWDKSVTAGNVSVMSRLTGVSEESLGMLSLLDWTCLQRGMSYFFVESPPGTA